MEGKRKNKRRSQKNKLTLMRDLKNRPQHLMPLFTLVRCVLGVLHLVAELQQSIFKIVEAVGWRFAVARGANRWHFCGRKVRMRMERDMDMTMVSS